MKAPQQWHVFTSEGCAVIDTLWAPGPTERTVMGSYDTPEVAQLVATQLQHTYDVIRNAFVG